MPLFVNKYHASSFQSTMNNEKNGNADIDASYSHRRRSASYHHIIDGDITKTKCNGTGHITYRNPSTQ